MADQEIQTRVKSVLEDPSAQQVSRVYANAFLDAAAAAGVDNPLEELASFIDDVLSAFPEFEQLLLSGIVNRDEKLGLIKRVVGPNGSEFFANFLRVLAQHDRLELLDLILSESRTLHDERTGKKRVQVKSAVPLSDDAIQKIHNHLNETFPFEPIIESEVDASLLGGLVIRVDDQVYDSSLRTRMKQLQATLRERGVHEIQSGRDRFSHPEGD